MVSNGALRWITDRRIKTKITAMAVIISTVAIVVGVLAFVRLNHMRDRMETLREDNIYRLVQLNAMRGGIAGIYFNIIGVSSAPTEETRNASKEQVFKFDKTVDDALAGYQARSDEATKWRTNVDSFATAWTEYKAVRNLFYFKQSPPAGVTLPSDPGELVNRFVAVQDQMTKAIEDLGKFESAEADAMANDAFTTADRSKLIIGVVLGAGLLAAAALTWIIVSGISRPLREVGELLDGVAEGDLTRTVPVRSADEVGAMAASVNRATASVRQMIQTMARNASTLAGSATALSDSTAQISTNADDTSRQAGVLASASEEVARNVRSVAVGTEQMGAAMREVAVASEQAAGVAKEAVSAASSANSTVARLGESSMEIDNVVKLITSIAQQTNLLALNATIEAARAGAAGAGFAVVAGEVKELAQETAKATDDIARRVEAIQADTESAVSAIGEISEIITRISDYQNTIASAVEEQSTTTQEMNRNIGQAAAGTEDITRNVGNVSNAALVTRDHTNGGQRLADELAQMSAELEQVVAQFRY